MQLKVENGHVLVPDVDGLLGKKGAYRKAERLIMAKALGRRLMPGEFVAHRNYDTHDNRLENLELLQGSEKREYISRMAEWNGMLDDEEKGV